MVMEFLKAVASPGFFKVSGACEEGVEKNAINGYDKQEFSDTALGIMVKSIADAGIGIHSMKYTWVYLPGGNSEEDSG